MTWRGEKPRRFHPLPIALFVTGFYDKGDAILKLIEGSKFICSLILLYCLLKA